MLLLAASDLKCFALICLQLFCACLQNRLRTLPKKQLGPNRVFATGPYHDPNLMPFQLSQTGRTASKLSQDSLKGSSNFEPWALFPEKQLSTKLSKLPDCHTSMGRQLDDVFAAPEPPVGSPFQSQKLPQDVGTRQRTSSPQNQRAEKALSTDSRATGERGADRQKQTSSNRRREHSPLRVSLSIT